MKNNDAPLDPATVTALLRANVFTLSPADIGLNLASCAEVWGIMMELGYSEVVASLAVLADGSASVYLSDGSGAVGCGLHPEVRDAATKMLLVAQRMMGNCQAVTDYPLPTESQVRFYLLTTHGIVSAAVPRAELDDGAVDLAELYYAGHGVIGMIELLGAGVDVVDEMRLAQSKVQPHHPAGADDVSGQTISGIQSRGRACRILPYVGSAVRRWHS